MTHGLSWVVLSLLTAASWALVPISDKTVHHRYAASPLTLPLLIGIAQTCLGLVLLSFTSIPEEASLKPSGLALISGVLYGISTLISQRILFSEEVSRTIPITQSAPVFAALLALMFLNETISFIHWVGIGATIAGCMFLSIRTKSDMRIITFILFYSS